VQSIIGFESLDTSSGQIVCIGEIGGERSEIRRTSNSTGPSASYKEITLRDALQFDHPQDTKVYIVDWDRVEYQHAATVTGAKSTLMVYPRSVQADLPETIFVETTKSSGFYFTRFNESIGNTNSDWSDAIPYAGYDDNMVFSIKKRALDNLNEQIDGQIITHEYLNESLWEARREYHNAPGKRPFRRYFNKVIGTALTGSYRIELPTNIQRSATAENLYGVRIGSNPNMRYYDKKMFDADYVGIPHSTLELPYVAGISTSIWLTNGRDFSDSGSLVVEGSILGYTKVTGSQNSLTITDHSTYSASGGSDAWQNAAFGLPSKFTVFADPTGSSYIYFNRPIETAYVNQNIYADYYGTLVGYDSDADTLDEPEYDFYVNYLMAKIKHRKNRGENDITADPDYKLYVFNKEKALKNEYLATDIRIEPEIDHLRLPE
jgi:hypothetical protein